MTYNNCVTDILSKLSALPPRWAEIIACNICKLIDTQECNTATDCTDIRDCQTVTELSTFTTTNQVCISFKDEHGVTVKRCFSSEPFKDIINNTTGTCINPLWNQLTATEKWQAIIDNRCECCSPSTTTTTTEAPSTTTTTTQCTLCWTFSLYNPDTINHGFYYEDCSGNPFEIDVLPGETVWECGCPYSFAYERNFLIFTLIDDTGCNIPACDTCNQYLISNSNAYPVDIVYAECGSRLPKNLGIPAGEKRLTDCACTGSVQLLPDTFIDWTFDCPSESTTTTTTIPDTTTTTTTTTEAPTTTTTTSTTTTTTVPSVTEQSDYVYFTNRMTSSNRGAKIWFSTNEYYTPVTPASVVAANCLSTTDLGFSPPITITVKYWRDDVTASIDDGFGAVRAEDGIKTITIPADLLNYNVSSGAWQRGTGIFTLDEGTNIAAFEIIGVTAFYLVGSIQHAFQLPAFHHFIRVHNTFDEGSTGVIWFDL